MVVSQQFETTRCGEGQNAFSRCFLNVQHLFCILQWLEEINTVHLIKSMIVNAFLYSRPVAEVGGYTHLGVSLTMVKKKPCYGHTGEI